jgi:hypothetical protein
VLGCSVIQNRRIDTTVSFLNQKCVTSALEASRVAIKSC